MGIDLLSQKEKKICTFDCIYCQLGRTLNYKEKRRLYVPTKKIVEELDMLPKIKIDYIAFSGRGEPALAKNLGEAIKAVKVTRPEPVAILTNSSLMHKEDVRQELSLADFVIAKLDACSQGSFELINRPAGRMRFATFLDDIRKFREEFIGRFALQIMFVEQNKDRAKELAELAREINPDEVQINTPLRPCEVKPLPKGELSKIKEYFKDMNTISVYEIECKGVSPISKEDTLTRRSKIL